MELFFFSFFSHFVKCAFYFEWKVDPMNRGPHSLFCNMIIIHDFNYVKYSFSFFQRYEKKMWTTFRNWKWWELVIISLNWIEDPSAISVYGCGKFYHMLRNLKREKSWWEKNSVTSYLWWNFWFWRFHFLDKIFSIAIEGGINVHPSDWPFFWWNRTIELTFIKTMREKMVKFHGEVIKLCADLLWNFNEMLLMRMFRWTFSFSFF